MPTSSQGRCRRVVDSVVLIKSLSHQSQCQFIAHTACLLVAGSSVLEPDLDGADVKTDAFGQLTPSVVADVAAAVVLGTQLLKLIGAECCPTTTSTITAVTGWSATYPRSCTTIR